MKTLVMYHAKCLDGFTSAFIAHEALGDEGVEYRAMLYNHDPVPDVTGYDVVYILDFSFSHQEILTMCAQVHEKVILLDHHKTAKEELSPLVRDRSLADSLVIVFDMTKSGAMLTWEHFNPGVPPPVLVQYVQDYDLWTKKLPRTEEIHVVLDAMDLTFLEWSKVHDALAEYQGVRDVADRGAALIRYRDQNIKQILKNVYMTSIAGHVVPCVASPLWQSEIGNIICRGHPFGVVFFVDNLGQFKYSLRSDNTNPEAVDVSAIAAECGGGGHRNAAGYAYHSAPKINWLPLK